MRNQAISVKRIRSVCAVLSLLILLNAAHIQALASDLQTQAKTGERIVYGHSGEGRELLAYRFGSGPNVLVMGFAIHGYEDNFDRDGQCLVDCAYALIDHLSGNLLPNRYGWSVYILPCMNPDGLASGYTENGPGRCTTTYIRADGSLGTGYGIDLNRCFPADFKPQYNSRNYTTSRPMAALEAVALDAFLRDVQGNGLNVMIDVHGWYQECISQSAWLRDIFHTRFPESSQHENYGGTGYLSAYAVELGYEAMLFELPWSITSMEDYRNSGISEKMALCLDDLLRCGSVRSQLERAGLPWWDINARVEVRAEFPDTEPETVLPYSPDREVLSSGF